MELAATIGRLMLVLKGVDMRLVAAQAVLQTSRGRAEAKSYTHSGFRWSRSWQVPSHTLVLGGTVRTPTN